MYRTLKYLLEMLIMYVVFTLCDMPGMIKYLVVGILSLIYLFAGRKKTWSPAALICVSLPVIAYLLIGCFGAIVHGNVYDTTLKTFIFWIIPLLFAFSIYVFQGENMEKIVGIEFWTSSLAYLVINERFIVRFFQVESTFAFVFGVFLIYYIYKKKWIFCVPAAILMYMTDKRITILAVAVALLVLGILWFFRYDKKLAFTVWGAVIVAIHAYIWLICSGTFGYYCRGIGINTNGRVKMYGQMVEWFEKPVIFVGKGIGIVERLLEAWNIRAFANLHNDLLKFYIELGLVGLLLFLFCFGVALFLAERKFGKEKMCVMLAIIIYMILLLATDNVSIYILFLIPFYSILFALLSVDQENKFDYKDKKC